MWSAPGRGELQDRNAAETQRIDPAGQAVGVERVQGPLAGFLTAGGPDPLQTPEAQWRRPGPQGFGPADRRLQTPLQLLAVTWSHAAGSQLDCRHLPRLTTSALLQVGLHLGGTRRGARQRKRRQQCVGAPAAQATHPQNQDAPLVVVLLVLAVVGETARLCAGRTALAGHQRRPALPDPGGAIDFRRNVEYQYGSRRGNRDVHWQVGSRFPLSLLQGVNYSNSAFLRIS